MVNRALRALARRRGTSVGGLWFGIFACVAATLALGASTASAAACPNEQLRKESNLSPVSGTHYSEGLPDCRAYEMVSPLYKQGHDAEPDSPVGVPISADGDAFGWASEGGFSGTENYHFSFPITINTYLSHRTAQGWTTESSFAPANLVSFPYRDGLSSDYSPDLRSAQASCGFQGVNQGENPIAFSSIQCAMRKQRGEGWTPSPRFTSVNGEGVNGQTGFLGGSANMSRLFVQPGNDLLSDDTLEENKSAGIYEVSGIGTSPELRLVSVANDGSELTNLGAGIVLNNAKGKGPLLGDHREETIINGSDYQAISQTGETVFFTATPTAVQPPEGQQQTVYARVHCLAGSSSSCKEDGNNEWLETVPVSNPIPTQCTATGCPGPARTCPAEAELTKELGEATKVEAKLEIEKELGECHGFHDATYQGASADGSKVFFTTTQRLLNGDGDETGDLYEYDFTNRAGNPLTQISAGETFAGTDECGAAVSHTAGAGAEVEGVVRTSSDGSHVYFLANGVLTSKGNTWWNASGEEEHECPEPGPSNLYAYDTETGELKFVAHTISNGSGNETSGKEVNDNHRLAQTTPDGKYLVFSTPEAFAGVTKTEAARAAYRFDFTTGELTWISHAAPAGERPSECTPSDGCKGGEERSAFIAPLEATTSGAEADINDWNRAISGCPHGYSSAEQTQCPAGAYDGETIIFSSQEKLQNDDVSQAANVYEWRCASPCAHPATEGVVQMISDGRDPKGVNSIGSMTQAEERAEITPNVWQGNSGMSASGSDIFFLTHTPLVGQDTDVLADYYDARVEGGFPAPVKEPACAPEECQPGEGSPPNSPPAPSSQFAAAGNLVPALGGTLGVTVTKPKPLTRAQELTKALKACKKKPKKKQRATCESQARKKYGPKAKAKKKSKAKKSERRGK